MLLASLVNVLTAALALVGNLFYVLVYTRWLKRTTPQNIVIGGAAGAVPPLVGWAAVTGDLTLAGSLALPDRLLLDPAALLGARAPDPATTTRRRASRCFPSSAENGRPRARSSPTRVLIAVTVVPFVWGPLGLVYLVAALLLGSAFMWLALKLWRERTPRRAATLFHFSLLYLALLFVAMAVDPLLV